MSQTTQAFPSGSLIIDMGVHPQTVGNGLKPYGLPYALLQQKVPIDWSIDQIIGQNELWSKAYCMKNEIQ